jgi:hypothetical protein
MPRVTLLIEVLSGRSDGDIETVMPECDRECEWVRVLTERGDGGRERNEDALCEAIICEYG